MDNETWRWLTGGIAGLAAAAVAIVWGDTKAKVVKLETGKADRTELSDANGRINGLGAKLDEHSRREEDNFRDLLSKMSDNHAELLRELGRKADRAGAS